MKVRDLDLLRSFNYVYEARSITKAALKLSVTKASVAKRLMQLESELGYKLFRRSTRLITPTPEGDELYARSKSLLENVQEFEEALNFDSSMHGTVRVTCSVSMAQRFLARVLIDFQKQHPEIIMDLVVTDSVLDMVEHNIDLAIRINPVSTMGQVGVKLADHYLKVVASPKYLKNAPPLKKVTDLKDHPILYLTSYGNSRFSKSKSKLKEVVGPRSFMTNDPSLITKLIHEGIGVGVRSTWDVKEPLAKKEFVELFPKDPLEKIGEIWLLSSTGRIQSKRVRALFDHLALELKNWLN